MKLPLLAANAAVPAASFSILQADSFEVPYGQYAHGVGMQIFDRESAVAMANDLSSLLGKLTRGFRGVPVYAGHPDHPDAKVSAQYPDRRARGWITEIIAGPESARFVVSYNELGRGEVSDSQWGGYSPLWLMRPIAANTGKPGQAFRPMVLKSIGLTNNPNIPVPPIIAANEEECAKIKDSPDEETPAPMKPELRAKLLKLAGLTDDATDEAFETALNEYCDKAMAAQEKPPEVEVLPPEKEAAANEALATLRGQIEAAVAVANEQAAGLKQTRIDFALDALVSSGRVTPAEREAVTSRLMAAANEGAFNSIISELKAAAPRLQTKPALSNGIASQRPVVIAANEDDSRKRQRDEAVAQVRTERPGISATLAWGIAAGRNPELFSR